MKPFFYLLIAFVLFSCKNDDNNNGGKSEPAPDQPQAISYSLVNTFPHDTSSFTEGLLIYKGELYESTGLKGKSKIMKVDLKTGKTIQETALDSQYFGEGIVIVNDTVYQLTYQEKIGFMYSLKDLKKIKDFKFTSPEGWGLTYNGKEIISSDGTSNLYYYEPGTFRHLRTQSVTEAGAYVSNINELEFIDGYIYANKWQEPYILKIDPATGKVVGKADLSGITTHIKNNYPFAEFMNGIAYDEVSKKIYVTGKFWPELFEVKFGN